MFFITHLCVECTPFYLKVFILRMAFKGTTSSCAVLRIIINNGRDLKDVQMIGKQDPFVEVIVLPWAQSGKTKASSGVNPVWTSKHGNVLDLSYYGLPLPGNEPMLDISVFDAEVTRSDRIIGRSQVKIAKCLGGKGAKDMSVELKDDDGKSAGHLQFSVEMILIGTVCVRVIEATHLKNVQRVFEQDPYAKIKLNDGKSKSTKPSKGINPRWTKRHGNVLKFRYEGEDEPVLQIQVIDKEYVHSDSPIGTGGLALTSKIINDLGDGIKEVNTTVELLDDKYLPAGRILLGISFVNDAYDESKPVVRGLSGLVQLQSHLKGQKPDQFLKLFLATVKIELNRTAPQLVTKLSKKSKIPVHFLMVAMIGLTFGFSLFVLLANGPKILSHVVAVFIPCYLSFKAVETDDKDDDTQWLTYWVLLGVLALVEDTVLYFVVEKYPWLFYPLKAIFALWLMSGQGALILYRGLVQPVLRKYEDSIDGTVEKLKKKSKETDSMIDHVSKQANELLHQTE